MSDSETTTTGAETTSSTSSTSKKSRDSRDRHFVNRSMFSSTGFVERRDLEQYFWTEKTVSEILNAIRFIYGAEGSCCLCTPTLATAYWDEGEAASLLDIDKRFSFLPKFRYFDLRDPTATDLGSEQHAWRVVVFDPPFFYIPMQVLFDAVMHICNNEPKTIKLLLGFLKREEKCLMETFKVFGLKQTKFQLEYAHVKSNKWKNYAMYSNVDLPGIKRITV